MVGGRLDEDAKSASTPEAEALKADLRQAYERGRMDERTRRPRHPVLMTLTVLCAAFGLVVLVLAGVNGSFQGGGAAVDHGLARAGDQVGHAASGAGAS
jgi:hypothetical protein